MNFGVVPKILAKQNEQGYWETPERFYTAKYKGTVWQLIILAEHEADARAVGRCFERHSCHMGVDKALKALAAIPVDKRSESVKDTIERGAEYMLIHHIHKRSHNLTRVSKPSWLQFGFILMYQRDVLEVLGILTKIGYRDERIQEAVDLVISKQDDHGRWRLERTFNGRFQTNIEQKGKPSKWITLNALKALKNFYT
jgi:hypothetical protein